MAQKIVRLINTRLQHRAFDKSLLIKLFKTDSIETVKAWQECF